MDLKDKTELDSSGEEKDALLKQKNKFNGS